MGRFLRLKLPCFCCRTVYIVLSLLWISGLLLGILMSCFADSVLSPTMLSAPDGSLSIFCFLSALLLPLIISVLSVYLSQPCIIFPVVFTKAFLFSFVGFGFLNSFVTSGWLMRCLMMFSDSLALPILWCVWLQAFSNDRRALMQFSALAAALILLIGFFDYAFIVPFLATLI